MARRAEHPSTVWGLVEATAVARPDQVLLADDCGRVLTAATLRDRANAVAAALVERGVGSGTVVSWQLPTTLEAIVLLVALARLDAVQNPLIAILREREVGFITAQAGTELLIVPRRWRGFDHEVLARDLAAARGFDVLTVDLEEPVDAASLRLPMRDPATLPPPRRAAEPDRSLVRWLYYTSGTTADPKGARHTDASVMASAAGMIENAGFTGADVYPIAWPVPHIGGITVLTTGLVTGVRLVLFDSFDPATTPERMAAHHPTLLGTAVPFFNAYMAAQRRHGEAPLFPRLRACVGGGAPIPAEVHDELQRTLGVPGVVGSWGLTEFPIATSATPDDPRDVLVHTVGRLSSGVELRAQGVDGAVIAAGREGELVLRGPQQFLGYLDATLDAAALTDDGWFRTGDLGHIDLAGNVHITGRLKEIVIRNAENISALEVEEALHRHSSVAEAAVIGLPDSRTGERVCAVVVLRPGTDLQLGSLRDHCRGLGLAAQKCPEQLVIVEQLPRNSMGKVQKPQLRQRILEAHPSN